MTGRAACSLALWAALVARAGAQSRLTEVGEPLADALRAVQATGVRVVFSEELVRADMQVTALPRGTTAETVLQSLLRPHGLEVKRGPGRSWLVVRGAASRPKGAAPAASVPQPPTGTITGHLLDPGTANPLAHVPVWLDVRRRPPGLQLTTDGEGRFEWPAVTSGPHELRVAIVGYIWVNRTVEVRPGQTTDITIAMAEGTGPYREDVTVRAQGPGERETGVATQDVLGSAALQNLRGVMLDDPLRAVQALPGVEATDDLHGVFAVRGTDPDHLGFVVDGIPTRFLLHRVQIADGGGSTSMINGDVLERASLLSGAYPQRFGNRIGAQLELDLRQGSRDHTSARVGLSGSSASIVGEGPLGGGHKGSWLVSARKSYLDWLLSRTFGKPSFDFAFEDAVARVAYDVTPRHQLEATGIWGRSRFDDKADGLGANGLASGRSRTWLAGARWRYTPGATAVVTQQLFGVGAAFHNSNRTGIELDHFTAHDIGYRGTVAYAPHASLMVDAGMQAGRSAERRSAQSQHRDGAAFAPDQDYDAAGGALGAHAQLRWTPRSFALVLGTRVDLWSTLARTSASPWLAAEWRPTAATRLTAATGIHRQAPRFDQVLGQRGNPDLRPERAAHYDVGIEHTSRGLRWRVTAYDREENDIARLPDAEVREDHGVVSLPSQTTRYANALTGRARGVELLLARDLPHGVSGWVSYGLGSVRYRDALTGEAFDGDFDSRHNLTAYGSWRLSPRMTLVMKFRGASNFPLVGYLRQTQVQESLGSPLAGASVPLPTPPPGASNQEVQRTVTAYFLDDQRNAVRLPFYSRLDIRANRTFTWSTRRLTLFAEVANVCNRTNLRGAEGDVNGFTGRVRNRTEALFPIFPSAGLLFEF